MKAIVEIIKSKEDGVLYYKFKCDRHPEINTNVFWLNLAKQMHHTAEVINNKYNEGCYFTIED